MKVKEKQSHLWSAQTRRPSAFSSSDRGTGSTSALLAASRPLVALARQEPHPVLASPLPSSIVSRLMSFLRGPHSHFSRPPMASSIAGPAAASRPLLTCPVASRCSGCPGCPGCSVDAMAWVPRSRQVSPAAGNWAYHVSASGLPSHSARLALLGGHFGVAHRPSVAILGVLFRFPFTPGARAALSLAAAASRGPTRAIVPIVAFSALASRRAIPSVGRPPVRTILPHHVLALVSGGRARRTARQDLSVRIPERLPGLATPRPVTAVQVWHRLGLLEHVVDAGNLSSAPSAPGSLVRGRGPRWHHCFRRWRRSHACRVWLSYV